MIPLALGLLALACLLVFMVTELPRCWHCETIWGVTRRRQNTEYRDDESNFVVLCRDCHIDNNAYWEERWADYRSGRY